MSLKKSKGLVILAVVCLLAVVMVTGCGQGAVEEPTNGNANGNGAEPVPVEEGLTGSLMVAGSTSVDFVSRALAEAFMAKHTETSIMTQSIGSSAGINAANEGTADIGSSSRYLREGEKEFGLSEFIIARDGIAVVVHPANDITDLTLEQVRGIFAGEITNWQEVGGADEEIMAVTREEGSGTRGAFEDMVMDDTYIGDGVIVQPSTGAVRSAVAGNEDAVGYISLAALNEEVKTVRVDGVEPTEKNILAGTYQIARPFIFITKGEPSGLAKEFIDFVLSSEGQAVVAAEDLIRVD